LKTRNLELAPVRDHLKILDFKPEAPSVGEIFGGDMTREFLNMLSILKHLMKLVICTLLVQNFPVSILGNVEKTRVSTPGRRFLPCYISSIDKMISL